MSGFLESARVFESMVEPGLGKVSGSAGLLLATVKSQLSKVNNYRGNLLGYKLFSFIISNHFNW